MRYVLITPAKNERMFIAGVIESVVAQTVLPLRWVIVDDGSSDRTADIVIEYAARHPWIELVRRPPRADRHFAGKVQLEEEGCLSVPGFNATVMRPARAVVKGLTREGREYQHEATGLLARAFQHEMDHLDGQLFIDRLRGIKRDLIVRRIRKLKRSGKW